MSFSFSFLVSFFILHSSFFASDSVSPSFDHMSFTGLCAFVYFAPVPSLCCLILFFRFFVMPVYRKLPLHLRMYMVHVFSFIW